MTQRQTLLHPSNHVQSQLSRSHRFSPYTTQPNIHPLSISGADRNLFPPLGRQGAVLKMYTLRFPLGGPVSAPHSLLEETLFTTSSSIRHRQSLRHYWTGVVICVAPLCWHNLPFCNCLLPNHYISDLLNKVVIQAANVVVWQSQFSINWPYLIAYIGYSYL